MLNLYDFITDSRLFKKFQVDDLLFVEYHCIIDEVTTGYWTHCNYLNYIVTGRKKWRTVDKEFICYPGEALFFKKGAFIAEKFIDEEYCSLVIFLPDNFITTVMQKHNLRYQGKTVDISEESILTVNVDNVLESYFHSVLNYFPLQQPPSDELLKVKFEEFVLNILSNTRNPSLASYFEQVRSSSKISLREIMEANFAYNMNLEEFAKLSGRSLSTFHRDFQKKFETSPGKWLTNRRIEHARLLLETTDKSINEVSFESGFENPSHFIRVFKDKFKSTPLRFKSTL